MRRIQLLIILSLIVFSGSSLAQGEAAVAAARTAPSSSSSAPAVSASVSEAGGVRFAAPGQVLQMRLEIYNAGGELVFDSGLRQGSIIDWKLTDATQAMTDGSYVSVVTVKDFQGKAWQRVAAVAVQAGQVSLKRLAANEVTAPQSKALAASVQAQKLDPAETGDVAIMREGKERAATVAAHDGEKGGLTSTKGALTFNTGNLFSGAEREQMRITPEGRVGIGTDKPQAALDVAGEVRARATASASPMARCSPPPASSRARTRAQAPSRLRPRL